MEEILKSKKLADRQVTVDGVLTLVSVDKLKLRPNSYDYYNYYTESENGTLVIDEIAEAKDKLEILVTDWKNNRKTLVDNILIEYKGVQYQGDEESQTRLDRASRVLEKKDIMHPESAPHTMTWIAKDNSEHKLNSDDLLKICLLAGEEQSRIWNDGRPE